MIGLATMVEPAIGARMLACPALGLVFANVTVFLRKTIYVILVMI
jgi:hypothetical protein